MLSIELDSGRVTGHEISFRSGYPTLSVDDILVAVKAVILDAEFNKSVVARGLALSDLNCITPSAGWYGPDEEGKRVIKVQCFLARGTPNFYMRPIEGLTATVDIDNRKVVKISIQVGEFQSQKALIRITGMRPKK